MDRWCGRLDIMLAKGRHWPLVDQVLNDGRRTFHAVPLGAADRTYAGLLVDLDGDRDLDVVISNDEPDPKRLYVNDGSCAVCDCRRRSPARSISQTSQKIHASTGFDRPHSARERMDSSRRDGRHCA